MKLHFKIFFLLISISGTINAQVGMNSNHPDKAVALDLSGTNKGLLIARIALSSTTDISTISGGMPAESLMVYNTYANIGGVGAAGTGYYYWETNIWKKLVTSGDIPNAAWGLVGNDNTVASSNFVGTTDMKGLNVETGSISRMFVADNGNVGVGKFNDDAYRIDIKGDMRIKDKLFIGAKNAPEGLAQLVLGDNGEVLAVSSANGSTKSYSYVKYTLSNVGGDWIEDFDTKILISDYVAVVVGSSFKTVGHVDLYTNNGTSTFGPQVVNAFKNGSTWRIQADYTAGAPASGNGTWEVYLLIINNRSIKTLTDQSLNLGGAKTGSFASMPAGL